MSTPYFSPADIKTKTGKVLFGNLTLSEGWDEQAAAAAVLTIEDEARAAIRASEPLENPHHTGAYDDCAWCSRVAIRASEPLDCHRAFGSNYCTTHQAEWSMDGLFRCPAARRASEPLDETLEPKMPPDQPYREFRVLADAGTWYGFPPRASEPLDEARARLLRLRDRGFDIAHWEKAEADLIAAVRAKCEAVRGYAKTGASLAHLNGHGVMVRHNGNLWECEAERCIKARELIWTAEERAPKVQP